MTRQLLLGASAALLIACGGAELDTDDMADATQTATETLAERVDAATEIDVCDGFGPQTPRDISNVSGTNMDAFAMAPASTELNLCNIHTHTQAEHRGPGFSVEKSAMEGFQCNETASLSEAELADYDGDVHFEGAVPGDTIEVHWVHSSCDIEPGEGLGSCLSETCTDPLLRVETQVFLVVNDRNALDFTTMDYVPGSGDGDGFHQPAMIPSNTGTPVVFRGSTTGPSYTEQTCSPLKVTWSVRPQCAKVDIASLHAWAEDNVFNEHESHGVRELVRDERLLSPIR